MRAMKIFVFVTFFAATALAVSSFAQPSPTSPAPGGKVPVPANPAGGTGASAPTGADMEKMMQQMMEQSKLNENHKLLASLDGTWNCNAQMWMDGDTSQKPD